MKQINHAISLVVFKITICLLPLMFLSVAMATNPVSQPRDGVISSADRVITASEIKSINPTKLLDALRILEPAFIGSGISENGTPLTSKIDQTYPSRGMGTWNDSRNVAISSVYIDGVEEPAYRLQEIDIDDIAFVTIVKDPLTLSKLGIKGANGAIAITTKTVIKGILRVRYNGDFSLSAADLSSFDLMNGSEKLAYENANGYYDNNQELYRQRVAANKNIDYARIPLRTAFSHRHRVDVEGGDDNVRYRLTGRVNPEQGVMGKSDVTTSGLNAFIEYKRDKLKVSNDLSYTANKSDEMLLSFIDYAFTNPYFDPRNSNGRLSRYLGEKNFDMTYNPEYESSLGSYVKNTGNTLSERLKVSYDFGSGFELSALGAFSNYKSKQDGYISPKSYVFIDSGADDNGSYMIDRYTTSSLQATIDLSYSKEIGRSTLGANLGGGIMAMKCSNELYGGKGLLSDNMVHISFAKYYSNQHYAERTYDRTASGDLSVYYNYDNRYSIEGNVHADYSSLLAKEKRTAIFWGVSANWNLKNEQFLKDNTTVTKLVAGVSTATTGAVDFTLNQSSLVYSNMIGNEYIYNYFLTGASIMGMPNEHLKWRSSHNTSVWVDGEISRLAFRLEYYNNVSTDLLVVGELPLAVGYNVQMTNGGKISNRGFEYSLRYTLAADRQFKLGIFTAGITSRNTIESIPEFDREYRNDAMSTNIEEGDDVNTLYDKDFGKVSADPKLRGNFGVNIGYKQLFATIAGSYSIGGHVYNNELARRSMPQYNQSRRAAELVGQSVSPLERYDWVSLGTVQLGYKFKVEKLRKYYLKGLSVYFTANDLVHCASQRIERFETYPFVRRYTLSLSAQF